MPDPGPHRSHAELTAIFRHFARHRCGRYAPLYARLGTAIAADPALLTLAACAPPGQSPPDLLLAAVHYLLARCPGDPLARHYPTLTSQPDPSDPVPPFRDFCHRHHGQLTSLIATRTVQTNEVRRCCYLLPAVVLAARHARQPLALIEPGASAGLNLALDRYAYHYGTATPGPGPDAPLILHCQLRGPHRPPPHQAMPSIRWRAGIDLHPLNPASPRDAAWLRALTWADHPSRITRLNHALTAAAAGPAIPVHTGDAAEILPALIAAAPAGLAVCVFHTAFLAHLPAARRQQFEHLVPALSARRPVYWIQAEPRSSPAEPRLRLTLCQHGQISSQWPLGHYHPHGAWLHWLTSS
ncbi:MAG: DUF2332 domain-containing protein [Streptosporangiaceae bacterium]